MGEHRVGLGERATMAAYPRTYRVSRGWQIFLIGSSLILGVPSTFGVLYFASGREADTKGATYLLIGICFIFAALSFYLLLTTLRSKIVLFADRIEIHELTVTHSLRRDEIAGWRINGSPGLILEQKHPAGKTISTAWLHKADPEFDHWFSNLDNLDEREAESALREIADDDSLGSDEEERFESLLRATRLTRLLNSIGGALFFWGVFLPRPYEVVFVLLLLAPWLAALFAWRSSGLIQLDGRPKDVRPNLSFLALFPMLALAFRAVLDFETVGWVTQTVAALLIGGALFAAQEAAHAGVRGNRLTTVVTFLFTFLAYGYGAAIHINALADSSDIQQTRYVLHEKYVSTGKVVRYRVRLTKAHLNTPEVSSAEVTPYFYDMLKPGDAVCLAFRPGALGIQWYSAGPCPPGTP